MVDATAGSELSLVPGFEVVLMHDGRCSTIVVHGELDLATSEVLAVTLDGIRANGERRVIVDLGDAFVDVAGLRPLERAANDGLAVRIRNATPLTSKMLLLTGLDGCFVIEEPPVVA